MQLYTIISCIITRVYNNICTTGFHTLILHLHSFVSDLAKEWKIGGAPLSNSYRYMYFTSDMVLIMYKYVLMFEIALIFNLFPVKYLYMYTIYSGTTK